MNKRFVLVLVPALVLALALCACGGSAPEPTKAPAAVPAGTLKLNAHPASLEGKTVVLRWNSKPNGDKYLNRVGEMLSQKVKGVKVIKLWEQDAGTAAISKSNEDSVALAGKIAALKPDLVIASQAD